MPRPAAATCAAALSMLLLAGCTDPAPPTEPGTTTAEATSPSPSASPEASPTPTTTRVVLAPEPPAEINDDGYEGAGAAAEYFPRLDSYIMKTNDTEAWEAMSHRECEACANRLEQAHEIEEADYTFSGGDITTRSLHVYEQDQATGIWPVDIEVEVAPVEIVDSSGEVMFTQDAVKSESRMEMVFQDGDWLVVNIASLEEKAD